MSTILVFDADPKVANFFGSEFPGELQFLCVSTWKEALKVMGSVTLDLILVHTDPEDEIQDDLLDEVRSLQKCEVLLFSSASKNDLMRLSKRLLADGYIQKIFDAEITQMFLKPHLTKRSAPAPTAPATSMGDPRHKHLEKTTRVNINQFLREQFSLKGPNSAEHS